MPVATRQIHARIIIQMLPVPGTKVKYYRQKILQVLRALAVFRVYVLRILRVLTVFRGSLLRILPDSQYFGIRYCCEYSLYHTSKYFGVLYCGYGKYWQYFVARTASTRSTKILSACPVYPENGVYLDYL